MREVWKPEENKVFQLPLRFWASQRSSQLRWSVSHLLMCDFPGSSLWTGDWLGGATFPSFSPLRRNWKYVLSLSCLNISLDGRLTVSLLQWMFTDEWHAPLPCLSSSVIQQWRIWVGPGGGGGWQVVICLGWLPRAIFLASTLSEPMSQGQVLQQPG